MSQINATNMSKAAVMVLALVFAGCSSVDSPFDAKGVLPADGAIHINTASVDAPASRAGQNNDQLVPFGLFITNAASADNSYSNVCLKQVSGVWESYTGADAAATEKVMYWQNATQPVTVTAYSPYASAATATGTLSGTVQTNQTVEGADKASDLLYATSAQVTPSASATPAAGSRIVYDGTTKALNVNFAHQLSKVRVNIKLSDEFDLPATVTVNLQGVNTAWQMSMADGTVSAGSAAVTADIGMKKETAAVTGYDATLEAIVVPQTMAPAIGIIVNGQNYLFTAASQAYETGKLYTYNLKVGKDAVSLATALSVSDWGTGSESEIKSEDVISNPVLIEALKAKGVSVDAADGYIHPDNASTRAQLNAVTTLDVSGKGLTSLDGLQYLTKLTELNCSNNKLTSLDVSKHFSLTTLDCSNNLLTAFSVTRNLTSLFCQANRLSVLDISVSYLEDPTKFKCDNQKDENGNPRQLLLILNSGQNSKFADILGSTVTTKIVVVTT